MKIRMYSSHADHHLESLRIVIILPPFLILTPWMMKIIFMIFIRVMMKRIRTLSNIIRWGQERKPMDINDLPRCLTTCPSVRMMMETVSFISVLVITLIPSRLVALCHSLRVVSSLLNTVQRLWIRRMNTMWSFWIDIDPFLKAVLQKRVPLMDSIQRRKEKKFYSKKTWLYSVYKTCLLFWIM